ncbi:MAG: c-type cytochrome [Pontibacterium sp.]
MLRTSKRYTLVLCTLTLLAACGEDNDAPAPQSKVPTNTVLGLNELTLDAKPDTQRWYYTPQAERGKKVFAANCAICHGANAESTPHWRTVDNNGHYPPPPLNGSAHAWHHPMTMLGSTIYNGGAPVGGQMPAFKDKLSETDIIDVIAHFQTYWSDDIYQQWLQIEHRARNR